MPLTLPRPLQYWTEATAAALLHPPGASPTDFAEPAGEAALAAADSVAWRVFKNPVALFVGGVAAVILELAEPRVRTGVWEHTGFREDPLGRLQRTGLAAMVTVYGPRSVAERMIARIVRAHEAVRGHTPSGEPYHANDPELLRWVQATAAFGFGEAYSRYVRPLSGESFDQLLAEGAPAAELYGAEGVPTSRAGLAALFDATRPRLEPSPILAEFLRIMRRAPVLPVPLRLLQGLLVRAAVDLLPEPDRRRLGLLAEGLRPWERPLLRAMGRLADRLVLRNGPAVRACLRLGLPADYLYGR
ncbi:oxygenase MpaB family protein [Muricoccus aerilatus]|uniref:oxygenase MpaB family protein n=1 Tax=Muricoccus aerilatus TaxID=452982 RepID=UPI0009FC7441|nr:oxygenase MpaB family protein [Roseomonas aerilata]